MNGLWFVSVTEQKSRLQDKPGRMNTKFSNFTPRHLLYIKNVERTNNKKWQ